MVNAAVGAGGRGGEQLDAIAGRNDQPFFDDFLIDEAAERVVQPRFAERQPLAHLDGRRLMTQSDKNDVHDNLQSFVLRPSSWVRRSLRKDMTNDSGPGTSD